MAHFFKKKIINITMWHTKLIGKPGPHFAIFVLFNCHFWLQSIDKDSINFCKRIHYKDDVLI